MFAFVGRFFAGVGILGTAFAAFAAFLAFRGVADSEESYSRAAVSNCAREYLALAPAAPDMSLSILTTDQFKSLEQGEESQYVTFWRGVATVDFKAVTSDPDDGLNWFRVRYEITYRDGSRESVNARWRMTCANRLAKYLPFYDCPGRDLLLHDLQPAD